MYLVVGGADVVVLSDAGELVRIVLVVMGSSDVDGITVLLSVDVSATAKDSGVSIHETAASTHRDRKWSAI